MILTDGVQTLVGMEKKKLLDLDVNSCAGVKIVVQNFQVRRGIAMLRPENCCVLGGYSSAALRETSLTHKQSTSFTSILECSSCSPMSACARCHSIRTCGVSSSTLQDGGRSRETTAQKARR